MRILDVRPGHVRRDVAAARAALAAELAHPEKVVMIVRGNSPSTALFADRAAGRAAPFPFREVVWVRDRRIFMPGQERRLFEGEDEWCAVVLDLDDEPVVWLADHASTLDIELAFLDAQASRS